ncbi:MAG: ABC transporter permease [Gemmatimonadetes bacterium]|nr:ABC transporter permease [Gemmatimonadota bacterium]
MPTPLPLAARLILRLSLPQRDREFLAGDVAEDYARARAEGRLAGWRWLAPQILGAVAASVALRTKHIRQRFATRLTNPVTHRKGDPAVDMLFRNIRFSLRALRKQPGYTALVVFTLALGIGANTAIFSVVNAVLLRALPFPESDRMVVVSETVALDPANQVSTAYVTYRDYRDESTTIEKMGAVFGGTVVLTGADEALRLQARFVSPSFLELLGARPAIGRVFDAGDDEAPDAHPVAIISHGLWGRRFGNDPNVIGRSISLDNRPYTVVGVMSEDFRDLSNAQFSADVWIPLLMSGHVLRAGWFDNRLIRNFFLMGRLKAGETVERADRELQQIAAKIAEQNPQSNKNFGATVIDLKQSMFGNLETPLYALLVGAAFLLVVACANVAGLVLVRSANRRREITMRLALGASRSRLVGLLTTEAVLLGIMGGVIGVGLSTVFLELFLNLNPVQLPSFTSIDLEASVLLLSFATSVVAGLVFGVAPAIKSAGTDLRSELSASDSRSGGDRSSHMTRNALVVFEVATAVVLLVGSGLMIRSFQELRGTSMGFRTEQVLTLRLNLSAQQYPDDQVYGFIRDLNERLNALPGVQWAGTWGPGVPGQAGTMTTAVPEGKVVQSQLDADLARFHHVSPGTMEGMELRLLSGRFIGDQDRAESSPVVVISQSMAEGFWPGGSPLGRKIRNFVPPGANLAEYPWYEVVGVVADANHAGRVSFGNLTTTYDMYFAYEHRVPRGSRGFSALLGTVGDPYDVLASVQGAIREMDSNLPVFFVRSMTEVVQREEQLSQFTASLMGTFGLLSLFLAALGIYGVLSQTVTQRTREIGLRIALGARPGETVRWFVGRGMRLVGLGVTIGIVSAFGLTRFVSSMLFGVQPTDTIAMSSAVGMLLVVALIASYLPTRRALRVDPMMTLRAD